MSPDLEALGWNAEFERQFAKYAAKDWLPGRLIRDNKITFGAILAGGARHEVIMGGRVYHEAANDAELPAVGDWVALEIGGEVSTNLIRARLPRQTCFSRKVPGKSTEEQVIATNVDAVAVVTDAGVDFNLRRLERYLTVIRKSGAQAIILLNKADLFSEADNHRARDAVQALDPRVTVLLSNAHSQSGVAGLRALLKPGFTITLVGSSGVGKSTLANQLLGRDWQWTDAVSDQTGKGVHTTTARELIPIPTGGILIDNPGIREIQMWTDETVLRESFADLDELANGCRHHNCRHGADAGCAVRAAVEAGTLDFDRYAAYLKLEDEIAALNKKQRKRKLQIEKGIRTSSESVKHPKGKYKRERRPWTS